MPDLVVLLLLLAAATTAAIRKKLTPPAALTGAIIGAIIFEGAGFMGLTLLVVFFLVGTAATSWRKEQKFGIKGAAAHQSTRHSGQVLANSAVAAIASALAIAIPAQRALFLLMTAASLSSATSDTLSSELGMVYGRRFFNILTGRPDEKGRDGVISFEGLLAGIAGSALIAVLYSLFQSQWGRPFLIILISGTFGNLADSALGAVFERRGLLSNDGVNLLNTLLAAVFAGVLTWPGADP